PLSEMNAAPLSPRVIAIRAGDVLQGTRGPLQEQNAEAGVPHGVQLPPPISMRMRREPGAVRLLIADQRRRAFGIPGVGPELLDAAKNGRAFERIEEVVGHPAAVRNMLRGTRV